MEERSVTKLLVLSCVIVAFFALLAYEFRFFLELPIFKDKHLFVIGILSAPENFQQRLSIRKTWLQLVPEVSASAYFIIGNEVCEVPLFDRADPYSCIDKPFVLPENATVLTEFTTMKIQNVDSKLITSVPGFVGFGFYIRSRIRINKLGIWRELLLLLNKEIQVKLISSIDSTVLASVTFNSELLNESTSPILSKTINPITLNGNFEGLIRLETKDIANMFFPKCNFAFWEEEPYVINFIQLWQEGSLIPQPFNKKSCTFVFMSYNILDIENIKQHSNNRTMRLKEWRKLSRELSLKLKNEIKVYNDIFLVNVVDVYRNLSMKLVNFYRRIKSKEDFQYILKADDDSFIDVLRVYEQLKLANGEMDNETGQTISQNNAATPELSKFWLWGSFKELWKVERTGKWREDQYRSVSYPTFPCGGGYVLNKEIVNYLGANNHLYHFQGEDVSLGIWLSALHVIYHKTSKIISEYNSYELQKTVITKFKGVKYWKYFEMNKTINKIVSNLCEWTCTNIKYPNTPMCNKVQLSTQKMHETWKDYIKKGFL